MKIIRMSNSWDPDQILPFVGSDLGPNCLQRISAGDTSMQGVDSQIRYSYYGVNSQQFPKLCKQSIRFRTYLKQQSLFNIWK